MDAQSLSLVRLSSPNGVVRLGVIVDGHVAAFFDMTPEEAEDMAADLAQAADFEAAAARCHYQAPDAPQ